MRMLLCLKEEIDYIDAAKRRLYLAWESLDKKISQKIINENLIKEFKEGGRIMPTIVRDNERSYAIDLISQINDLSQRYTLQIKKAGGERTISTSRNGRMFPDVVLYGDAERTRIIQGWELKLPDTLITDENFIKDAQRKAISLGLNSCFIWNFTAGALYIKR